MHSFFVQAIRFSGSDYMLPDMTLIEIIKQSTFWLHLHTLPLNAITEDSFLIFLLIDKFAILFVYELGFKGVCAIFNNENTSDHFKKL